MGIEYCIKTITSGTFWGALHTVQKTWSPHSCAQFLCQQKGWGGGGGWGHLQGDMHMLAARLGCEIVMVGTKRGTSHPDCMDRLTKHYSHFVGGWLLPRKAAWVLSGCMTTKRADYYMLVIESVWLRSWVCLLMLDVDLSSILETEMEIWCTKGMRMLKVVVWSEKNLGFKVN